MEHAVVARDLVKRYGSVEAVRGLSFDVPVGRVFGFLGPNGAGKSSTMRMIHAMIPVTSGRLEVLGMDVTSRARDVKRRLGVVPQESNLDSDMNVEETLLVHGRFFDVPRAEMKRRAGELLEYVGLTDKARARTPELSGGMRRRLLIARALVNDPDLLILDEPTTGLDPQSRAVLWERIRQLRRAGKTVILSTHYMDEAEKLADRLVIVDEGRIVAQGTPAGLIREHLPREVVELALDPTADAPLLARLGEAAPFHERVGERLHLFTDKGEALLEEVHRAGVQPEASLVRRATLEDVFLKLTGRTLHD